MSGHGFLQVVQYPPLLQTQRRYRRQRPPHEPTAIFTLTAERALPSQDRRTDRALRRVVGRLDPFDPSEGPQRRLHRLNLSTRGGGPGHGP
jgi:hypothetical protein